VTLVCIVCGRRKVRTMDPATVFMSSLPGVEGDVVQGRCPRCKREGFEMGLAAAKAEIARLADYIARLSAYLARAGRQVPAAKASSMSSPAVSASESNSR
jgi:hypothetical protein